jgi:hypothetical protein
LKGKEAMNLSVAPKFGIWGGPNGDQSCFGPGRRNPIPRQQPVEKTGKTDEDIMEFVADLTNKAKLVKVTYPGNGRRSTSVEAEFTFGSKNVYTINIKADGTFTASNKDGDITFSYTHNKNVYGSPREFAYNNDNDAEQNFNTMARNLGQDTFVEKLRTLINKAPVTKGGKKKPTV